MSVIAGDASAVNTICCYLISAPKGILPRPRTNVVSCSNFVNLVLYIMIRAQTSCGNIFILRATSRQKDVCKRSPAGTTASLHL